jgi:hypothetical protein
VRGFYVKRLCAGVWSKCAGHVSQFGEINIKPESSALSLARGLSLAGGLDSRRLYA